MFIGSATALRCTVHGITNRVFVESLDDHVNKCPVCRQPLGTTGSGVLRPGRFTVGDTEDGQPVFAGYHAGSHWNGWGCPAFRKAEGLRLMEHINAMNREFADGPGEFLAAYFDAERRAFVPYL